MTGPLSAWRAALVYTLAAVAMTWPLLPQIHRSMAGDLGDPLLNAWILTWGAKHATAILGGDLGAFARWWNANIFHPSPLTLAYSEHLTPLVVMGLPVWWATKNALLVYNVLFLASMALSGLGMFLLVRELTGRPRAALVAGLFFAFVPYRIAQMPHLQVLWSQWMPFALYGFRCYLERGRPRALVGAVAALLAQQLSCGYYLIYFSPFVALYLAWEITVRRRWRDVRLLTSLAVAAIADVALAWPFLAPYLELRALGFPPRPIDEVAAYAADTTAYFATHPTNRVWGSVLESLGRPENELFPGLLPLVMAAIGLVALVRWRWTATATPRRRRRDAGSPPSLPRSRPSACSAPCGSSPGERELPDRGRADAPHPRHRAHAGVRPCGSGRTAGLVAAGARVLHLGAPTFAPVRCCSCWSRSCSPGDPTRAAGRPLRFTGRISGCTSSSPASTACACRPGWRWSLTSSWR